MEYVQKNKIKKNIKIKVTHEQSKKVQQICFDNGIYWVDKTKELYHPLHGKEVYLLISNNIMFWNKESNKKFEEIDADLFIRTNGTCEKISDEGLSKIKAAFQGKPIEYLQEKVINLYKQINKDRIIIKNQKKELNNLNLKLQKCISLEEHHLKMKTVLNEKHKLEVENKSLKDSSKISCNMIHQQRDTIVSLRDEVIIKVDNMTYTKNKEIEKLKAVIEYLESKLK